MKKAGSLHGPKEKKKYGPFGPVFGLLSAEHLCNADTPVGQSPGGTRKIEDFVGRGGRNGAERRPRRQAGTERAEFLPAMWGLTPWSGHSSGTAILSMGCPFTYDILSPR